MTDNTYSLASTADARTSRDLPYSVSHDDALRAAQALIDYYFNRSDRASIHIPAADDDTDVVLTNYIKQQKELTDAISNSTEHADAAQKWELEKAELLSVLRSAENSLLRNRAKVSELAPIRQVIAKYEAK